MKTSIGDCDTCGRFMCMAGSGRLARCKYYVSKEIMARTYRDEPANVRAIRGMA